LGALVLAACGPQSGALPGDPVDCAIGDATNLTPVCTLEQLGDNSSFVLHHPQGGFRRFRFDAETLEIEPADGAEGATGLAADAEHLVFGVGADRYRIPATLLMKPR
jgi:hypothetical protein